MVHQATIKTSDFTLIDDVTLIFRVNSGVLKLWMIVFGHGITVRKHIYIAHVRVLNDILE